MTQLLLLIRLALDSETSYWRYLPHTRFSMFYSLI